MKKEITINDLIIDNENCLTIGEGKQRLTNKEALLLKAFLKNPNRIIERSSFLTEIWGSSDHFSGRSMDVYLSKLRKILSPLEGVSISNIHGVGFQLNISQSEE